MATWLWILLATLSLSGIPARAGDDSSERDITLSVAGEATLTKGDEKPFIRLEKIFRPRLSTENSKQSLEEDSEALRAKSKPGDATLKKELQALQLRQRLDSSDIDEELLDRIPDGSVLVLLRAEAPLAQRCLISRRDGRLFVRPLAPEEGKEQELLSYLGQYLLSPQIKGIRLLEVSEKVR